MNATIFGQPAGDDDWVMLERFNVCDVVVDVTWAHGSGYGNSTPHDLHVHLQNDDRIHGDWVEEMITLTLQELP